METSIWDMIQDEHLLVSQNNELITKSKGDIKNLTDDERERLMNIRGSIRKRRSILHSCLSETTNYGIPLFVLNEGESDEESYEDCRNRKGGNIMSKRKLFISQPFTGYDETTIQKQREVLHKVFSEFIGEEIDNVELINQLTPNDSYDVRGNFKSDKEQDLYRFCRSIGLLGKATDIVLYGDWEKSRGCKLEVEILKQFGINIIDQKLLIAFCIKNNMVSELEELWPEESENLKGVTALKQIPTDMVSVVALSSDAVADDEIIISHSSSLGLRIPAGVKVYTFRYPTNGTILELTPRVTWNSEKFPFIEECVDVVYVSPNTASKLCMDIDQWGDIIQLIILQKKLHEPSEEEIQEVLDDTYPICIIKDRYGGVYSGGRYTAWYSDIPNTPYGIYEDDVTCAHTWGELRAVRQNGKLVYGIGKTPDEALRDLAIAIIRNSKEDK